MLDRIHHHDDLGHASAHALAETFSVESTLSLNPPISWAPLTNAPVIVGNDKLLTLAPTNVTQFLRLRKP